MEISKLMADPDLAVSGVWRKMPGKDCEFKLAYRGSIRFENAQAKIALKVGQKNADEGNSTDEISDENLSYMVEAVVEHLLLDWKGLLLKGEPFLYNKENARKLLLWSEPVRNWIWKESGHPDIFNTEESAVAAGKSEPAVDA